MNDIVDYFVIVESTHTFTGKEKTCFFNDNKDFFEKFSKKIIHIIVDNFPYKYPNINYNNNEQWTNEFFQRDAISRGLNSINNLEQNDLITVTDLDEIPDPNTLVSIKKGDITVDINILEMDNYYYNLNTRFNTKWPLCKIISFKKYKELNTTCSNIRNINCSVIKNGGWHLSCFGDANFIKNKLQNFSHQEYNNDYYTNLEKIEERINTQTDLVCLGRPIEKINIKDNNYLPLQYDSYLKKYCIY